MSMRLYEAGYNDHILRRAVCTISFLECPGYQGTKTRVTSKTGLFTQPKTGQSNYMGDNVKLLFSYAGLYWFTCNLKGLLDYLLNLHNPTITQLLGRNDFNLTFMIFFGELPYDVGYQKKHTKPHGGGQGPLLYPAQTSPSWLNFFTRQNVIFLFFQKALPA